MAAQTVTSENFQEFVTTGVVAALAPIPKEEETKEVEAKEVKADEKNVDKKTDADKDEASLSDAELTERASKRINTKHRQMREAQELAEARAIELKEAKANAERLQQELDAIKSGSPPKDELKPNPKDFEDPFAYAEALAKYESQKAIKADREERAEERRKAEDKARIAAFAQRVAETKKTLTDFDEVVSGSEFILKQDAIDYLIESDYGPRLAYYLASNEEEVERLNGLSHARRLAALGKLETRFEKQEAKPPVPEVSQSKAPAPIAVLNGNGSAVEKDPAKMTTQEYLVYRRQKELEKRKH